MMNEFVISVRILPTSVRRLPTSVMGLPTSVMGLPTKLPGHLTDQKQKKPDLTPKVAATFKEVTATIKEVAGTFKLGTIETDLRNKNKAQETALHKAPVTTQTRHKLLNAVWDFNVTVNAASELVFKDDFAKQQQYLLYPEAAPPPLQLLLTLTANQIPLSHLSMGIKGTPAQADNCSINWGDTTASALTLSGIYQNSAHDYLTQGIYTIEQKSSKPENITGLIGSGGAFNAYAGIQLSPLLVNLEELNFSGNRFTTISIPIELNQLSIVFLVAGNLDAASVNNLLITINGFNTNGGTINISGGTNAAPTGQGIAAKN